VDTDRITKGNMCRNAADVYIVSRLTTDGCQLRTEVWQLIM
jgi:hypothetical protein